MLRKTCYVISMCSVVFLIRAGWGLSQAMLPGQNLHIHTQQMKHQEYSYFFKEFWSLKHHLQKTGSKLPLGSGSLHFVINLQA